MAFHYGVTIGSRSRRALAVLIDGGMVNKFCLRGLQFFILFLAGLTAVRSASSQASASQILNQVMGTSGTPSAGTAQASGSSDPLGRSTPRGTVFGFLQSAQLGKYDTAAQYLQLTNSQRRNDGQRLAEQLLVVINRGFTGNVNSITDQPGGTEQIGVPPGHQQIGILGLGDTEVPLDLVRATDADGNKIWLISSDTLSKLPELYSQTQIHQLETHLPPSLVRFLILGMPARQWLAMILLIPLALGVAWLFIRLAMYLTWVVERLRKQPPVKPVLHGVSTRLLWVAATILHRVGVGYLVIPVFVRAYYVRVAWIVLLSRFLGSVRGSYGARWRPSRRERSRRAARVSDRWYFSASASQTSS